MNEYEQFLQERSERIAGYALSPDWRSMSMAWMQNAFEHKYMYNFEVLGRPVIQMPADIVAIQEAIWKASPDLVIEAGIAHGGSLTLSASMLALLEYREAAKTGEMLDPAKPKRKVIGIDIDIRPHNRLAIESHCMASRIQLIEGSSTSAEVLAAVRASSQGFGKILVILDSNHTHDHVLAELESYAPFVSRASYCIVMDTIVEDLDASASVNRPWHPGNSPKTAVHEYLRRLADEGRTAVDGSVLSFGVDQEVNRKLMLTACPDGFLYRA